MPLSGRWLKKTITNIGRRSGRLTGNSTQHYSALVQTDHVSPTRKVVRYTGGLWVGKYLRMQTCLEILNPEAIGEPDQLGRRAARAQSLDAHTRSGDLRAATHLHD